MAQTTNVPIDAALIRRFDAFCTGIGTDVTTMFTVFAKTLVDTPSKISTKPSEPEEDPFYTHPVNRARLLSAIDDYRNNRGESITKTMEELEAMANE